MKKFICVLSLILVYLASDAQPQIIDKVVAKVGGEYLLYSELISSYRYAKDRNPEIDEAAICAITEQVLAQKILIDQAKLDSIEVSDAEIEGNIDVRIQQILRPMQGDEARFEEYYGKSIVEVKEDMRDEMRQQLLAQRIQGKLINEVTITPKEVKEFFSKIPNDSIPFLNAEVEVSEIVRRPIVNEEEKSKAIAKLEEIKSAIISGESTFEEMAQKFSQDGSRQSGGDLGWASRGSYVAEFEAAAYELEKGELSDIVESEFGFHIIKLKERRGNSINVQHILIRPEITSSDLGLASDKLDSIRNLVVVDSLPFEYAVTIYSDKKSDNYHNGGRMQNPKTGTAYFETADLPSDIYFKIEDMEIGEISEPIEFFDLRGETLYRIIRLESRTKPHRASLDQDYSRIATFAKESKKNLYYNNWMLEKLDETFIEIDPDLKSCDNLSKWIKTSDTSDE